MNSRQNIFIFSLIIILLTPGWSVFASEKSPGNLYALSAVLMDGDSGRVLYQKSGNTPRPNASTTKVMTCILALENGKGDDYVKVSANAVSLTGSTPWSFNRRTILSGRPSLFPDVAES